MQVETLELKQGWEMDLEISRNSMFSSQHSLEATQLEDSVILWKNTANSIPNAYYFSRISAKEVIISLLLFNTFFPSFVSNAINSSHLS